HGYSVLGQLYGRIKLFEDNIINLYRYEYNTPFIGKNDSRMTPNTFEGYTLQGAYGGKDGAPGFRYGAGYITKIKERNSDDFVWMSRDAGADVKRGVGVAGGLFTYGKFSLGAINYYSNDIINIFYTESKYTLPITKDLGAALAFQFADQRSTGDDLLKGRSFTTNQLGVKGDLSYGGAVFTLGYTNTLRRDDMQNPWSGYPGYTSVQVQDFNRAEEQAVITKLSYDFSRLGLEGVSSYVLFVHGSGRVDPSTGRGVPNENEFNFDLQWRPKWKFIEGFSFRYRYSHVHQYQGPKNNQDDFRVIINYDFPLM
ncbi:MAG: OprD family outer membrane porin, partial [Candidatus Binatia bacterium]